MIKKQYVKSRNVCKVTFSLPLAELPEGKVSTAAVVGSFNDWNPNSTPMKFSKAKKAYRATVELAPDAEYEFRYLINGNQWVNEWQADDYVPNNIDGDNCIVITTQ